MAATSDKRPILGFIGAGKVGQTLARLLHERGYAIGAIYSPTPHHAQDLAAHTHAQVAASAVDVAAACDLIFLTVPDDVIEPVAQVFSQAKALDWRGRGVVHTSGAASLDRLQSLAEQGAWVGSLHPAFPFADVDNAMQQLPGAAFAIEANHETLSGWLTGLVQALDGQLIAIPAGGKAAYHAALVIASNYMVTLYAIAEKMLLDLGAARPAADAALNALIAATAANLREQGIPQALTGPLTRADTGTLQAHLDALTTDADDTLRDVYLGLAALSLPMLAERGVPLDAIEQFLQENSHAFDNQ